jgi:hypothetical protein
MLSVQNFLFFDYNLVSLSQVMKLIFVAIIYLRNRFRTKHLVNLVIDVNLENISHEKFSSIILLAIHQKSFRTSGFGL